MNTPDPTTQPAQAYYCAQCGNRLGEVAAACSDCPRRFCSADCNDAHDCLRRRPDPTTHCIHCGRVCGDYDGGTASVEDMPLCHPNAVGRPDCYRMVTVYGHPLIACKQCATTTEADPRDGQPCAACGTIRVDGHCPGCREAVKRAIANVDAQPAPGDRVLIEAEVICDPPNLRVRTIPAGPSYDGRSLSTSSYFDLPQVYWRPMPAPDDEHGDRPHADAIRALRVGMVERGIAFRFDEAVPAVRA
jgi:hypothetical protein